jgi:hypothetical protein
LAQRDRQMHDSTTGKAIHRVLTDGISPEQAVNEAIARIEQISAIAGRT